jgi:Flp pilus assembly protein TadD
LRLNPASALLHEDLGVALEKSGRIPEAIEQYEQALKLSPDFTTARDAIERLQAHGPSIDVAARNPTPKPRPVLRIGLSALSEVIP